MTFLHSWDALSLEGTERKSEGEGKRGRGKRRIRGGKRSKGSGRKKGRRKREKRKGNALKSWYP